MTTAWEPYREPLRATLLRNGLIALAVGGVLAALHGGVGRWPAAALVALWPALGGHCVEVGFLNGLRPRISRARAVQVAARVAIWFVGGMVLALGMALTARAMGATGPGWWPSWWVGGLAFVAIELVAHGGLRFRGRPCFYDGRG